MPFSGGGGAGPLTNHVHDLTPLQGGPLNFNNTTVGGMAAGDITFSDGAALQTLNAPAVPAGEFLTFAPAAVAPSWGAGPSAASMQLVASQVLGVDSNSIEFALAPAVQQADISYLVIVLNSDVNVSGAANHTYLTMNSIGSFYNQQGYFIQGGAQSFINQVSQNEWRFARVSHGYERGGIAYLWCNTVTEHMQGLMQSVSDDTLQVTSGYNTTAAQTEFNRVKVWMSDPAALMLAGSRCDVYKVVNT